MALFYLGFVLTLLLSLHPSFTISFKDNSLETYIIHIDVPDDQGSGDSKELENWYHLFLSKTIPGFDTKTRMVHTYKNVIKGFAAQLTPDEYLAIQEHEECLHATPHEMLAVHMTHSPSFLGLNQGLGFWKDSKFGDGVIIGVVDTGIFPDHLSFSDEGMSPPPPKWKGRCEFNFTACNSKLIGARYFAFGQGTPLDIDGHGTHVASTAAGNFVPGANIFGQANGTAVGIAPRAHLAIYKVCPDGTRCPSSDILAAVDAAIEDGVDVLSLSIGGVTTSFPFNAIALGAFTAVQKGIFVSCLAGNSGPYRQSLSNEAPWILTVGASTVDRKFKATTVLGNNVVIEGESIVQPNNFSHDPLPIVYLGYFCFSSQSLLEANATGKIVVCKSSFLNPTRAVSAVRAAAMILINFEGDGVTKKLNPIPLPTIDISFDDGSKIISYINTTAKPVATLSFQGTVIGDNHAPIVAGFSSRGPSKNSPGILKPDIIGPGVNILAASHISLEGDKTTKSNFAIMSGTSMSCPHLSGVAALLKSVHPDWSPAAIKSAMMTTADVVNLAHNPIEDQKLMPADVFAVGAGHVNPSRANDPGLIYDIQPQDYIPYLCGLQYSNREVAIITQQKVNCSEVQKIHQSQLNYPSFSILFGPDVQTYTRTVTNVGEAKSTYVVKISPLAEFNVSVKPEKLEFSEMNQKLTYQVTFTNALSNSSTTGDFSEGFLMWSWGKHNVRSPIVAIIVG